MPEGAEVRRVAFVLNKLFSGLMCHHIIILPKYRKSHGNELYSSMPLNYQNKDGYKQVDIGSILTRVTSKGKKIIFELNELPGVMGRFVSSLGLNGIWALQYTSRTALIIKFGNQFAFYEETYIGGNFSVCMYNSNEYNHIFKDVGPDLMTDEVTWDVFLSGLRNKRVLNMTIYDFLMNQKYFSGCGNWVTAEVLFKCRIKPTRLMSQINDQDCWNLFNWIKKILWDAYNAGGLTIRDYVDPLGEEGKYVTECYGRNFDLYGNIVIKEENKTGRKMHYSPLLQPF